MIEGPSKVCCKCGKLHKDIYQLEQFKKDFKAGDIVEGYSTNAQVVITAIGEERFLYRDYVGERVATIVNCDAKWRKPKETS